MVPVSTGEIDMGIIMLIEDVKMLKEVTISASKITMESKPGMTIYNVAADPLAIGKSMIDVASNLPGLSQDGTGGLTYGGSSQVAVLINGRKSNLSPTDILQQMQPDNVERIELITGANPRFVSSDAIATINIVLKKNRDQGWNGSAAVTANSFGFFNGSLNVSKSSPTTTFYTKLGSDDRFLQNHINYRRRDLVNDTDIFSGRITNDVHHSFRTFTAGMDKYLDSMNVLTIEYVGSLHSDAMNATTTQNRPDGTGFLMNVETDPRERENTLSVNHQVNFGSKCQMESEASFTGFSMNSTSVYQSSNNADILNMNNYALRARSEYTTPFAKKYSLSLGADYVRVKTANSSVRIVDDQKSERRFTYLNEKAALYASLIIKPEKNISIRPGVRMEFAKTEAISAELGNTAFVLTNPYPTLNIQAEMGKKGTLSLDLIRKIQYPALFALYRFPNQPDTFNIQTGNIQLVPSLRHEAIMEHRLVTSKATSTIQLYGRYVTDVMQQYSFEEPGNRIRTITANVGNMFNYGGFLNGSLDITKKWNLRAGVNFSFTNIRLAEDVTAVNTKLYAISGNINNRLVISKRSDGEMTFRVLNYSRLLSDSFRPMYNLSFQYNYKFSDGKWVLGILANDVLFTMVNREALRPGEFTIHEINARYRSRFVQITVRYKFGKASKIRNRKLESEKIQFTNG